MPINSESAKTDVPKNITDSNGTKTETELIVTPENKENSTLESEAADISSKPDNTTNQPENIDNIESARNVDDLKSFQNNEAIKEEDNKFKDSPQDVAPHEIHRQSEVWKDFTDDFALLEDRMPDLTDEEFDQINGDGAMPWNFLKSLDVKRNIDEIKPRPVQAYTPIYITVPIVINTHSSLPISVTIGGQKIPLKLPSETKQQPSVLASDKVKASAGSPIVTPTSIFNKLMDYSEPPIRQTNRHRSNFRKKIYARNNEHQVEEFEYKSEEN
ncbi:uncharacterized protein LOC135963052 [Calliphora vicina]|uniref:uncharacterized protein LOC135963052 n=1 Tax=Calliphora vicina TaxID=7373 RepID=UPI00325A7DA2